MFFLSIHYLIARVLIQELEKNDAQAENTRKKLKSQINTGAATKFAKQAPKNPRKNKKANKAEAVVEMMETASSSTMEMGKPS